MKLRNEKPFVGSKIRELRKQRHWTLEACAAELGISISYLSQLETNQRPLSSRALLAILQTFDVDATIFEPAVDLRLTADLREACAALTVAQAPMPLSEIRRVAQGAPRFAREFLDLYRAFRKLEERIKTLDETVATPHLPDAFATSPYDEVGDFFHYRNNYIHDLDLAAEALARETGLGAGPSLEGELERLLSDRYGIWVERRPEPELLRRFDEARRTLTLNAAHPAETRTFQLAVHAASSALSDVIERELDGATFRSVEALAICRVALENYAAAALVMPYGAFATAARETRHDIERLGTHFGASLEQVCHRLSTLQRPSQRGVPIYFLRMDAAGNVTKRHSATRFHFARSGGTCPLWNVHEAAFTPDRFAVQVAETPDGGRHLCVARSILKPSGAFLQPARRYILGFGCELSRASEFVYGDVVDLQTAPTAIGSSCRFCERTGCQHRALPPFEGRIKVSREQRSIVPFAIEAASLAET